VRILWIPHAGWHIPQREHLFCRALADKHEVHVTDWVADFHTPLDYLSRKFARSLIPGTYQDGAIMVHRVPRISPALPFRSLRQLNASIFLKTAQHIVDHHNIDVVVGTFVTSPPSAPRLVFDLFDDNVSFWRTGGRSHAYADEIEEVERRYLNEADAVVAASSVLADMARAAGTSRPIHHIPNGINLRAFDGLQRDVVRRELGMTGSVVGSIGNHDSVGEIDKLLAAAQMLAPDGVQFVIAGRGSAVPYTVERVWRENMTNVTVQDYLAPDEARKLAVALDVGLCPYVKTTMDDARSPMRLLMYAAAGIPIVCTDLEEVRRIKFANVVMVEDDVIEFAEGIRRALSIPLGRPPEIAHFDLPLLVHTYEAILTNQWVEAYA
jgi:glycosyltransferase involved in cell wall biosynthesis